MTAPVLTAECVSGSVIGIAVGSTNTSSVEAPWNVNEPTTNSGVFVGYEVALNALFAEPLVLMPSSTSPVSTASGRTNRPAKVV